MSPTTLRRILVSIPVLLTGSCALNNEGWEMRPEARSLPAVFVDATPAQIQHECPTTQNAIGCAVRYPSRNVCFIYVEPNAPKWLAAHELYHCAGFTHS